MESETIPVRSRRSVASARAALVTLLLCTAFLQGVFPLWDTDFWLHLRTGQLIVERHAVPETDWFRYVSPDRPWIDVYWLFQVALAGLYAAGGVPLITLVKSAVGAAVVGTSLLARPRRWPIEMAVLVWVPALITLGGRLYERPEIVSLWLVAAFLAVLFHARSRPELLWLLLPLQALWVNCHGMFVLGPAILAMFWVDVAWQRLLRAADSGAFLERLSLATLGTALACLANPYGWRIVALPAQQWSMLSGDNVFWRSNIGELRSIGDYLARAGMLEGGRFSLAGLVGAVLTTPYVVSFFVILLLALGSCAASALRGCLTPFPLLLCVAFAHLGWSATRNLGFFALVLATVTTWNLGALQDARDRTGHRSPGGRGRRQIATVALAALAVATVSNTLYAWAGEGRRFGLGQREDWFMHGAAQFAGRPGMPSRAFVAQAGQANVYTFHNGPERRVFLDGRMDPGSRELLERYLAIQVQMAAADPAFEHELVNESADPVSAERWPALLLERDRATPLIEGLARLPQWRPVYADAVAVVFLRDETAVRLNLPDLRETQ